MRNFLSEAPPVLVAFTRLRSVCHVPSQAQGCPYRGLPEMADA